MQMGYIPLTVVQLRMTGSYPAERHNTDLWSRLLVGFHILCGTLVIYGGAACWCTGRLLAWEVDPVVSNILAISTILHSVSNIGLLRKVPGYRLLTVPFYMFVSFCNAYHGWDLLQHGGGQRLLLVWNMMGTYVYVRYFVFLLGPLMGWKSWLDEKIYGVTYTLALPLAAIYGILLPTVALGRNMAWATLFACPIVLGPILVVVHRFLTQVKDAQATAPTGLASKVPASLLDPLMQTTDPANYHGTKSPQ